MSSLKGTGMTQYNRILSQAFSAYYVDHCNQFNLKKTDVNPEHLEIAKNMLESFKLDVETTWSADDTVDDKVSKLDVAAANAYNMFCRKQQPVVVKQKHMTPELVDEAVRVHRLWEGVTVLGDMSGIELWEKELREQMNQHTNQVTFGRLGMTQTLQAQWTQWNDTRKGLRIKINKARGEYYTKLINDSTGGNVANLGNHRQHRATKTQIHSHNAESGGGMVP